MEQFYRDQIAQIAQDDQSHSGLLSTNLDDEIHEEAQQAIKVAEPRILPVNHKMDGVKYVKNTIKTQKYTWPSFLPMCILSQFAVFSNQYFLVITLTQLFDTLQVGLAFTYYLPLALVIVVSIVKDFSDDLRRYKRDKSMNSELFETMSAGFLRSEDIQPGDILYLKKNQRAPADVVILQADDPRGLVFIRTDNLDGETDWKNRYSVPPLQQMTFREIADARGIVYVQQPAKDITRFEGRYVHAADQFANRQQFSLDLSNTIWAGCVVASTDCVCQVVYTGKETKAQLNTSTSKPKEGRVDVQMNLFVKGLFIFLCIISMVFTVFSAEPSILTFLRFFVLYNNVIPLSLKVSMDVGKMFAGLSMSRDPNVNRIQVNSTSIPEQLGRITHVFSDKTGTLTKNIMKVQKLVYGGAFVCTGFQEVIRDLTKPPVPSNSETTDGEKTGDNQKQNGVVQVNYAQLRAKMFSQAQSFVPSQKQPDQLTHNERLQLFIKAISTCHSVSTQGGELIASSPDEVALVKFAAECGFSLKQRDDFGMKVGEQNYSIKYAFPFNSTSKKMGIVLECSGKMFLFVKGADSIMAKILVQNYPWLQEKVDQLSCDGLRTLVFAYKELSTEDFAAFSERYNEANCLLVDREKVKQRIENELMTKLFLLGITGVEDQLQDGVQKTLQMFRAGGIKTWILSGDKVQTIKCIALSSGLVDPRAVQFNVIESQADFAECLEKVRQVRPNECLVIDGQSLQTLLGDRAFDYNNRQKLVTTIPEKVQPLNPCVKGWRKFRNFVTNYVAAVESKDLGDVGRNEFARITSTLQAVCCCRCSPDQKALICKLLSKYNRSETAAVGDGANDVSLLQAANIGFGIFGKEGVQAAMAADIAIGEFKDLQELIFWHGRNSYKNCVEVSQFIIQRGICGCFIQAWFSASRWFGSVVLHTGILMLGYACVYNIAPIMCMFLNEDMDYKQVKTYPELYKNLQKGRNFNTKTFFYWDALAIAGSALILFATVRFCTMFHEVALISFTALSVYQLLLICLTVQRWSLQMVIWLILSVVAYWVSLFLQADSFPTRYIMSDSYYVTSAYVVLCSSGPIFVISMLIRIFRPDQVTKLQFLQAKSKTCGCKTLVHTKSSTGYKYFNKGAHKDVEDRVGYTEI